MKMTRLEAMQRYGALQTIEKGKSGDGKEPWDLDWRTYEVITYILVELKKFVEGYQSARNNRMKMKAQGATISKDQFGSPQIDDPQKEFDFRLEEEAALQEIVSIRWPKEKLDLKLDINKTIPPTTLAVLGPDIVNLAKVEMDDD
jgi:hypothetical protein